MISTTIKAIGATCTVVAALAVVAVPTASAKHGHGVRVAGICDGDSRSKLKVKNDHGRLKVEFEVDQNVSGVVWDVAITNDGTTVFEGQRTTSDPSGSFSVERRVKHATSGTIEATATTPATATSPGESCTATLTVPAKPVVVTKPVTDPTAPAPVKNRDKQAVDDDPANHDANDDNGNSGKGNDDPAGHDANDSSGHHGNDD